MMSADYSAMKRKICGRKNHTKIWHSYKFVFNFMFEVLKCFYLHISLFADIINDQTFTG